MRPRVADAHAGSVIFTTECQMRYIGDALHLLIDDWKITASAQPEDHVIL